MVNIEDINIIFWKSLSKGIIKKDHGNKLVLV